ncbi:helix-turn-helix domain-containing protein [Fusobacterium ulcerans]|uniref:helix-turn-helix domain-containing protein n=1 Tax=Fusobacterium ulcerans TaxID=861 RepID=UPI0027BAB245|nr:XRE family transcriptional regulator [Fusobacterium ulcerans]
MFKIGEKLKTLRLKMGLSQSEVAEKINVTKPTYASYEKELRSINIDTLYELSKFFNVPLESFFTDTLNIFESISPTGSIKRLPIISRVSAGKGEYGTDDILDWIEMPVSLCKNCDYATFVKGDSMEPKILDNDLILVQKTNFLENGTIGIFRVQEDIFCKKYYSNPLTKEIILKSINSKYDSIYIDENFNEDFYILGKVVCKIDYNF